MGTRRGGIDVFRECRNDSKDLRGEITGAAYRNTVSPPYRGGNIARGTEPFGLPFSLAVNGQMHAVDRTDMKKRRFDDLFLFTACLIVSEENMETMSFRTLHQKSIQEAPVVEAADQKYTYTNQCTYLGVVANENADITTEIERLIRFITACLEKYG